MVETLAKQKRCAWLILNKTDLVGPAQLLPLTKEISGMLTVEHVFMLSARSGDGVEDLLDRLAAELPEGPYLYPEDDLTDLPDRLLAAELVREQIFMQTHEEIPYQATVETETFKERPDGSVRIDATIYVSRPGHKAILIGEGGQKIRSIGEKARLDLSRLLGRSRHLFLNVRDR